MKKTYFNQDIFSLLMGGGKSSLVILMMMLIHTSVWGQREPSPPPACPAAPCNLVNGDFNGILVQPPGGIYSLTLPVYIRDIRNNALAGVTNNTVDFYTLNGPMNVPGAGLGPNLNGSFGTEPFGYAAQFYCGNDDYQFNVPNPHPPIIPSATEAFIGMSAKTNQREIITLELCSNMVPGVTYNFSCWVYNICYGTIRLGFSQIRPCDQTSGVDVLPALEQLAALDCDPNDPQNPYFALTQGPIDYYFAAQAAPGTWHQITGQITATAAHEWLNIWFAGQNAGSYGAYYYLDDVVLTPQFDAAITGPTAICQGTQVTLTAQADAAFAPITYLWNTGATTASITAQVNATTTYTVTVTGGPGCQDVVSHLVTSYPAAPAQLTNTGPYCEGMAVTLNVPGNCNTCTYQWAGPNNFAQTTSQPTISPGTYLTSMNGWVYNVTVTTSYGCTATATTTIQSDPNCCELVQGYTLIPDGATLSNLVLNQTFASPTHNGGGLQTFLVQGWFYVDQTITIENTDFVLMPGARIILVNNPIAPTVLTLDRCHFSGCLRLWREIYVPMECTLFATDCSFKDAISAVNVNGGALHAQSNVFVDDFIGIHSFGDGLLVVSGNSFLGSANNLLPAGPYNIAGLQPAQRPWAGIYGRQRSLPISHIDDNYFEWLTKGAVFFSCPDVTLAHNKFVNIQGLAAPMGYGDGYYTYNHEGYAVSFLACKKALVESILDSEDFLDCDKGILAVKSGLSASWNWGRHLRVGITLSDCKNLYSIINGNLLEQIDQYGILLLANGAPGTQIEIYNNDITVDQFIYPYDGTFKGVGIQVSENTSTSKLRIVANYITLLGGLHGIEVLDARKPYLQENEVTIMPLNLPTPPYVAPKERVGIFVSYASGQVLNCNKVWYGVPQLAVDTDNSMGIYTYGSTEGHYTKNETNCTRDGIVFSGTCTNTRFQGNIFGMHRYGLRLTASANIGNGVGNGNLNLFCKSNIWLTGVGAYSMAGANHEASLLSFVRLSKLYVKDIYAPNAGNILHPTIGIGPNAIATTSPLGEPDFFLHVNFGCDWPCLAQGETASCTQLRPAALFTEMDESFAIGDLPLEVFEPEQNWQADRNLYEKSLGLEDSLAFPTDIMDFMAENTTAPLGKLGNLDWVSKEQKAMPVADKTNYEWITAQMGVLKEQIAPLEAQLADSLADTASIHASLEELYTDYQGLELQSSALIDSWEQHWKDTLVELRQTNADISTQNLPEQNEKTVNEWEMILESGFELDASQIDALSGLAMECPLLGGNAVIRARAIYSRYEQVYYDDREMCNQAGIAFRIGQNTTPSSIYVSPNPASDLLSLRRVDGSAMNGEFAVFNAIGTKVVSFLLDGQPIQNFPTANLPEGFYIGQWLQSDASSQLVKFVIAH